MTDNNVNVTEVLSDYEQLKLKYDSGKAKYDQMTQQVTDLQSELETKKKEIVELQARLYRNLSTEKEPIKQSSNFNDAYKQFMKENLQRVNNG